LLQQAPYLDALIGPDAVGRLPQILQAIESGCGPVVDLDLHQPGDPGFVPLCGARPRAISEPVTIMKGCDNFCSFCVVPHVRGRETSRGLDEILQEVEALTKQGCREVVLLGQNVNSYRDPSGATFARLLQALDAQGAAQRIRFTTSHPKDLGDDLVTALAVLPRVCQHVHLPLQSGSDRVLAKMNRGYSRRHFLERAAALRSRVEGLSLSTDLIVGFPGETEQDFQETLETVRTAAFDLAYSFMYSPRPRTPAAEWPDDVLPEVKARRLDELQIVLQQIEFLSLQRMVGSVTEVLVEQVSARDRNAWCGRTRCNRVVNFLGLGDRHAGDLVRVRLLERRGHTLWGEPEEAGGDQQKVDKIPGGLDRMGLRGGRRPE
jgi:tRNA-2-methylthio-N6-dimethylallyladenosine synthase